MTRAALPAAGDSLAASAGSASRLLDWDAELPLVGWRALTPAPERAGWSSLAWCGGAARTEMAGTRDSGAVPLEVVSVAVGVGVSRWGHAAAPLARADVHHLLVVGQEADVPGFVLPADGRYGRGAVVVQGVSAGEASWEAVTAAAARARAQLQEDVARSVAVTRTRAVVMVPSSWRVRGDGVVRWGPAASGVAIPDAVADAIAGLRHGQRSPLVRVLGSDGAHGPRWGWWQGVGLPASTAPLAHVVRMGVDAATLADAAALADAVSWHVSLAAATGHPWPTPDVQRQLRRSLGDATGLRRRLQTRLPGVVWAPAAADANAEAAAA